MASHYVGQRISYDGALCTVRYIGEVAGANGSWLGVEWDDASRGKHDGSHKGKRYFSCLSRAPTVASFVRPTRPAENGQSFIAALNEKYVGTDQEKESQPAQIMIGSKVAEEMGFDKIRRQMAELTELKVAIVDGARVDTAVTEGDAAIQDTCPKVTQLDISRNLFETIGPVVDICAGLPALRKLAINGNRFRNVLKDPKLDGAQNSFRNVTELGIGNVIMAWEEMCRIITQFPSLASLTAGTNQLSSLPFIDLSSLSATLTTINLEYNDFTAISNLASLTQLQNLRNLHLKGNNISAMAEEGEDGPIFPESLQYLDVSYNNVAAWSFVDSLPTHFPGLTALRIAHNPIYNAKAGDVRVSTSEESHMFTIARLAQLKSINFSAITKADRTNAEMFYLSRIAKQLAEVPESAEKSITDLHPRYTELCQIYGEPDVIRRQEINPAFLEARLINVEFTCDGKGTKSKRIPQAFDIYAVKGIAGRLFDMSPLALKLVWETGEWDPVAGFEDSDDDSSDDEDEAAAPAETPIESVEKAGDQDPNSVEGKSGRWVRREVELTDGPRQLGYCVDGMDVKVRVEPK